MKKNIYIKFIIRILLIGIIICFVNIFFYQLCIVDGNSMYPTLQNGNIACIKKFNFKLEHNDLIVIKKNNKIIIKRLVGLPDDKVKIDRYLYINGQRNDNFYTEYSGNVCDEIQLKDNEYFVLGDNRQSSIDSRFEEIGIIYENEIIGKIIWNEEDLLCKQ